VVFPLAGLNVSGGVKNLLAQASALAAAGHSVRLIAPDFAASSPFPLDPRIRVEVLATGGSRLRYYVRLADVAARDADLCVVAFYMTVWCAVLSRVRHGSGARILYSVAAFEPVTHGLLAPSPPLVRLARAALAWLSYRLPTTRVYASQWLRATVRDPGGVVVGRGIDRAIFSPGDRAADNPPRVGVIGRRGRVKGYDLVLAALDRPLDVPIEVRLLALDDVPDPRGVRSIRLDRRGEDGMAAFYRSCDIFLFASRSEGFPAPPLEAMACGCAVLTTDCGGVREYAEPDQNCLMVPSDDPAALRSALTRLASDSELRVRLAAAGVRTAERLDRRAMLARFVDLATAAAFPGPGPA
jgi:glycosyltransferase involved in cell wall biosynthesis